MRAMGLRQQAKWGVAAQFYGQAVTIGTQLVVLPMMLWLWGIERYGAWLIMSALPTYLAMGDLGFAQIAGNDMTMRVARGDAAGAVMVNQTAWLFVGSVCVLLLIVSALFVVLVPIADIFAITSADAPVVALATFALAAIAIASLAFAVIGGAMRAVGHYWFCFAATATAQLISAILLVLAALAGFEFVGVAAVTFAGNVSVLLVASIVFCRAYPQFMPHIGKADLGYLRDMLRPSLAYMSYLASQAISIQGMSLVIGAVLGPPVVVVLNAIRTLTRLGRLAAALLIHALEPIFGQLIAQGERARARRVFRDLLLAAAIGTAIYMCGMMVWGEPFLAWWTHGAIVGETALFWLMVFAVVCEVFWFALQTPFVSTNRHGVFAPWFLVLSSASLLLSWVGMERWGVVAAGGATLGLHAAMPAITLVLIARRGILR